MPPSIPLTFPPFATPLTPSHPQSFGQATLPTSFPSSGFQLKPFRPSRHTVFPSFLSLSLAFFLHHSFALLFPFHVLSVSFSLRPAQQTALSFFKIFLRRQQVDGESEREVERTSAGSLDDESLRAGVALEASVNDSAFCDPAWMNYGVEACF